MRRVSNLPSFVAVLFTLSACSDSSPSGADDDCGGETCAAGYVCVDDTCVQLCDSDRDCDTAGTICDNRVCVPGERTEQPVINRIDGDGAPDGDTGHTDHHIHRVLTIFGENLDGVSVTLDNGSQSLPATVCRTGSTEIEVELPETLAPGNYLLSAASQAGSCGASVQILQGNEGPAGPAGPLPVVATGGGMTGDGSSDSPIALDLQSTGPLSGAGSTASPLTMPVASASNDGYLSAADHAAFSQKRVIYYEVMTGSWLNSNANFGTARGHTLTGGRLDFTTGTNDWEHLMSVPVVSAGDLDANTRYVVRASFDITAVTSDNDITYGLSDGTNFVGAYRMDNDGSPAIQLVEAAVGAINETSWTLLGTSGNNNTYQRIVRLYFVLDSTTNVVAQLHTSTNSAAAIAPTPLSRTAALELVVVAGGSSEIYGINLIEASVVVLGK
jgi:hypothetical protein